MNTIVNHNQEIMELQRKIEELELEKERIIHIVNTTPTGEWDNPGMGFSPEWDEHKASRFKGEVLKRISGGNHV